MTITEQGQGATNLSPSNGPIDPDRDGDIHVDAVIKIVRKRKDIYKEVGRKAHHCTLKERGNAICLVMEDTKETRYWYDFAMTNTSGFLLRMFCKKVQDDKHIYFVSEKFDCTMNQFKKPSLWDYRTKRLDQDFTRILLDIMQGILYLHIDVKHTHGKISTENVFLVKGGVKLGNMLCAASCRENRKFKDDYFGFANLVDKVFQNIQKTTWLPYELQHFTNSIKLSNAP
ncbi:hypothetical protein LguiB_006705 [Lonicera macranthoides]